MTNLSKYAVSYRRIDGMVRWYARYKRDAAALICGDKVSSWAELNQSTNRMACALKNIGVCKGDNIALLLPNRSEMIYLYLAAARLGISVTPINYRLVASEIDYILDNSKAKFLIYDGEKSELISQLITNKRDGSFSKNKIFCLDDVGNGGFRHWKDESDDEIWDRELVGTESFFIGYTSGTTGFPKGCIQTHAAFIDVFKLSAFVYPIGESETMLIPGPLFHEAPTLFTLGQLYYGGSVVLMEAFDPAKALELIQKYRCTVLGFAVPTMLDALNTIVDGVDMTGIKAVITDGAPLYERTMNATLANFPNAELHEFYGATELGLVCNIDHRKLGRVGSCGKPLNGVAVKIFDQVGNAVKTGQPGIVYVTPRMTEGYLDNKEATENNTLIVDDIEWFTVGDIGYQDSEDYLYLVDRSSHMIISGGENIYPAEIETVLMSHPMIVDAAVIGVPDETWGQSVVAVLVLKDKQHIDLDGVREFLDGKLARFKWPKELRVVQELPRTASGKIQKHKIIL